MFTTEEIKIANATSRSMGASVFNPNGSIRAVVPQYVAQHMDKDKSILDFGAGKNAVHTLWLREQGFEKVTAYDFGQNLVKGLHNPDALNQQYRCVFASNVINTASSLDMLRETVQQINNVVEPGGICIINYPSAPRKAGLKTFVVREILESIFGRTVRLVAGTTSAPVWRVCKPIVH